MADQAQKDRFVEALTELGGSAGHVRLRETLQWDAATYNSVKEDLLAEGVVTPGRGRGGSMSLSNVAEAVAEEAAPVAARVKLARGNGNSNGGNLGFRGRTLQSRRQAARQYGAVGL
jgi:type I restriction enzyme M protein